MFARNRELYADGDFLSGVSQSCWYTKDDHLLTGRLCTVSNLRATAGDRQIVASMLEECALAVSIIAVPSAFDFMR